MTLWSHTNMDVCRWVVKVHVHGLRSISALTAPSLVNGKFSPILCISELSPGRNMLECHFLCICYIQCVSFWWECRPVAEAWVHEYCIHQCCSGFSPHFHFKHSSQNWTILSGYFWAVHRFAFFSSFSDQWQLNVATICLLQPSIIAIIFISSAYAHTHMCAS